jgi:uncharacterized protein (DUF488 family)
LADIAPSRLFEATARRGHRGRRNALRPSPALGTPPEGRLAGRRREWDRFWGIVEEKLARPEAELALQQAGEIAEAAPSCLLCYEADWQICHRRRIAEILTQRHGFAVRHLVFGGARVQE